MDELMVLLDEEIKKEMTDLGSFTTGSKEKSDATKNVAELLKLRTEATKVITEAAEKQERLRGEDADRERDEVFKQQQLRDQAVERYVKIGIAAIELILPLAFYGRWMKKGFKFEESGSFTSTTFRNLFSRFKPTKKG